MGTGRVSSYNFLVVLAAALGSFTYGFTVSVTGPVLGMPSFYNYFHLNITKTTGVIGAIPGCFFGGGVIGGIVGGWLCNKLGRHRALSITCLIGIIGGSLLGGAVHISMILIGRLLSGICAGAFLTIVPVYQSEISPAKHRGNLVGQHGFFLVVGSAEWIGLACSFSKIRQLQWRLPLALSALSPLILSIAMIWLPESPRWLLSRQRASQALQILESLHSSPDDPDHTVAKEEFVQIREQLEVEKEQRTRFLSVLKRPSMRKRFIIGFLTQFLMQSSGVMVTVTYQVILYENLGITGWLGILLLCVYSTWSAIGNFINANIVDRVGRVKLLFSGLLLATVSITLYTIMVALFAGTNNRVGCGFGVLFVYLFTTFYALCLDVTSFVYCAEIFPTYIRPAGMAFSISIGYFCPGLLYSQLAPIAFKNIAWRYYIVFIVIPVCGLPIIWFYFPETKGVPLEEIPALFGEKVAIDLSNMNPDKRASLDEKLTKIGTNDLVTHHLQTVPESQLHQTMEISRTGKE